jgi:ABC-2 type transport system ATP-binding protein
VIHELSWEVPHGRKVVLLGPNGAGKSTLLSLAADVLTPTAGARRWGGLDPARRGDRAGYRRAIAFMGQASRATPGLRVREQVAYAGWLKGMSRRDAWDSAYRALAEVGLADLGRESAARLSGGQLRRAHIAAALVHDAAVLLLDEPATGLDPAARASFRDTLRHLHGRSIVVSTHQIDDLDDLYDDVVVLVGGRIAFTGTVGAFVALAPPAVADGVRRFEAAYSAAVGG